MPRDCPLCGLWNTDTATHCECGYQVFKDVNRVGKANMVAGATLCGVAALLLLFAFAFRAANLALVNWPALLVGVPLFVRGGQPGPPHLEPLTGLLPQETGETPPAYLIVAARTEGSPGPPG